MKKMRANWKGVCIYEWWNCNKNLSFNLALRIEYNSVDLYLNTSGRLTYSLLFLTLSCRVKDRVYHMANQGNYRIKLCLVASQEHNPVGC